MGVPDTINHWIEQMILGNNIIAVNQSKEMTDLIFDLDFKIMNAKDCIHCIRDAIRYLPDLILADLESPQLNGMSMARILNTLMIRTPIILTAPDMKFRKHALSFNNVIGFVQHPPKGTAFPRDKVRAELESIIFNIEKINVESIEYAYSFRQREWANLLGKSGKKKILVIEDDKTVKTGMMRLLDSTREYDLYGAEDGLEGIFKALLVEPDLVLTDISMPNLDGLAMCQIFNILNKPFPVAFITTMDYKEIPQKAIKAQGVLGLIKKSILQEKRNFIAQINFFLDQTAAVKSGWADIEKDQPEDSSI